MSRVRAAPAPAAAARGEGAARAAAPAIAPRAVAVRDDGGTVVAARSAGHSFAALALHAPEETAPEDETAPTPRAAAVVAPPRVVQRQATGAPAAGAAPARDETAAGAAPAAGALVVDDAAADLQPGQMRKSELLERLRAESCAAADAAMARTGRSTQGCPYVERALARYASRDAATLERAVRRYAPEASAARTASDYVPAVAARIGRGAERWATTGELPEMPAELDESAAGGGDAGGVISAIGGALSAIGGAFSAIGRLFRKGPAAAAPAVTDAAAVAGALGPGQPLDPTPRARMESALGADFSTVRLHADGDAAALSRSLEARAFTVGPHVAFAAGEYRPGSPAGDALLAHELAHVVQQRGAAPPSPAAPLDAAPASADPYEQQADQAAQEAVVTLWDDGSARPRRRRRLASALRSGLQLQRCHHNQAPAQTALNVPTLTASLQAASISTIVAVFQSALDAIRISVTSGGTVSDSDATALAAAAGTRLWEVARAAAQGAAPVQGFSEHFEPLHQMRAAIRGLPGSPANARLTQLAGLMEQPFGDAARGISDVRFTTAAPSGTSVVRVLLTGFDPFSSGTVPPTAADWNPSGAVVLALDNRELNAGTNLVARMQGIVLPVSFEQFEARGAREGIVERALGPHLNEVDAVITVSLGDPNAAAVDLEAYAVGVRREYDIHPDPDATTPDETRPHRLVPVSAPLAGSTGVGPGVVPTSPLLSGVQSDVDAAGSPRPTIDTHLIFDVADDSTANALFADLGLTSRPSVGPATFLASGGPEPGPQPRTDPPRRRQFQLRDPAVSRLLAAVQSRTGTTLNVSLVPPGAAAGASPNLYSVRIIEGPGGSFLSNEVSFRTLRLLNAARPTNTPTSFHVHVPRPGATPDLRQLILTLERIVISVASRVPRPTPAP
ncbi:MAG TPA: DUF4157 domain-containing protein [Myxococcota bacterium]|nr:DUF4157 domain-containing protein [Myxococcota bacterium]